MREDTGEKILKVEKLIFLGYGLMIGMAVSILVGLAPPPDSSSEEREGSVSLCRERCTEEGAELTSFSFVEDGEVECTCTQILDQGICYD